MTHPRVPLSGDGERDRSGNTPGVHHLTELDEGYFVLAGAGEIWRASDDREAVTALRQPGGWRCRQWRPISDSPRLRRVGSVIGLIVCVPLTGLLTVVAIVLAGTTCDPNSFCFGGPQDALVVAVPATYGVALCLLMALALGSRDDRRAGQVSGTLAMALASGVFVLVADGFALSALGL
jgi:hypothetical protein